MGLGKTFVGAEKMTQIGNDVNLIVCQKSKINDWMEHFQKFYSYIPEFTYDLTNRKQMGDFFNHVNCTDATKESCFGIINYELAWRRPELRNLTNFTLMLDESSLIQNQKAKQTKFIMSLKPSNVILLSGTPTAGKYENLLTQCHLLGWDISENAYNSQYVNWRKIEVGGFIHKIVDKRNPYKNVERLKSKLREHGAVFMKTEEAFELPEQIFTKVMVQSSSDYRKFNKNKIIEIEGNELVGDTLLTERLYKKQLCGMYSKNKLQAFKDLVQSTNDRLIVFYNYTGELERMIEIVNELERPVSIVNGQDKNLSAYKHEDDSITFVQFQAGAMGLNLQKANKIIYFTPPERSELFEQSKKRIHRIGQTNTCFYYLLLVEKSIETLEILPTLNLRKEYTDELFKED